MEIYLHMAGAATGGMLREAKISEIFEIWATNPIFHAITIFIQCRVFH